jgi:DNA-binding NtrC family response regulator
MKKRIKLNILIVDDDNDSLNAMQFALYQLGHVLKLSKDPEEALELYKKEDFDIVVTDMRMPKMNGIELLIAVRNHNENARVIIVTAYGDLDTAIQAINNRAFGFLSKPISIEKLYELVHVIEKEIKNNKTENVKKQKLEKSYLKLKNVYKELLTQLNFIETGIKNTRSKKNA